jgi:Flp pilus assembly protein CpaB
VKRSNRLVILVGVLLAVLAFVGIVILLNSEGGGTGVDPADALKVEVLKATEDLELGAEITEDNVELAEVDPEDVIGGAIGDPSAAVGRRLIYAVAQGGQVSQEAVGLGTSTACVPCQLQPGEKAIAFQVDRVTGLDFLVARGDHIDIVISQDLQVLQPTAESLEDPTGPQRFETIPGLESATTVKTILQNKRVVYVSATRTTTQVSTATPSPGAQPGQAPPPQQIENVIIVFAGTDQDAEAIKFAQNDLAELGALTAIVRSVEDNELPADGEEVTTGITIDLLVEQYGIPIPNIITDLGEEAAP